MNRWFNRWGRWLMLSLVILVANVVSSFVYARFDLTEEKRYTLSQQTRSLVENIDKPVVITVFLDGDLPSAFKRLRNSTKDLLKDYQAYGGSSVQINFVDPIADLTVAMQDSVINSLYEAGIEPTTLNIKNDAGFAQKTIFPMALIEANGRQIPLKLLQNQDAGGGYEHNINSSIENLEYAFTSAIEKVLSDDQLRIGFTEGNGELSDAMLGDAMESLSAHLEVGRVDLNTITKAGLDKLSALIVAKPQQEFTEAQKYKLNYFVMRGGKVVWCIDQVGAELDSMGKENEQLAFNRKLNLDDMLFVYGARVNYNLIADANCAEIPLSMGGREAGIQLAPWVYYPLLMPDTASSLVRNIDAVRTEFASTVDTIGVKGITKRTLLWSSAFNKVYDTPRLLSLQSVAEQPDPKDYLSVPKRVAVLLEGSFPSVFAHRQVPSGIRETYVVPERSKATKMIVIGDGDIFKNQVSSRDGSVFPLGFDRFTGRNYGNKVLLLNIVDYLTSDNDLFSLRNKNVKMRLLDRARLQSEKILWQALNIGLPLLMLISFAIFQHYLRKYRYAR
ncbi:gliding motility-associated ABC transporter substrate-binding protein GldG [Pedobacter faecalis]|uniref:gliding motility-associated ABC transporter substrate-binding protein GldG n=1 Tax=Pedobacter faecalis TaxID=3041495 RepID=UPI0033060F18